MKPTPWPLGAPVPWTVGDHKITLYELPEHETADIGCNWCRSYYRVQEGNQFPASLEICPACNGPEHRPAVPSLVRDWYAEGRTIATWRARPGIRAHAVCMCGRRWCYDGHTAAVADGWDICPGCVGTPPGDLAICLTRDKRRAMIASWLSAAGPELVARFVEYAGMHCFYLNGTWPDEQIAESLRDAGAVLLSSALAPPLVVSAALVPFPVRS